MDIFDQPTPFDDVDQIDDTKYQQHTSGNSNVNIFIDDDNDVIDYDKQQREQYDIEQEQQEKIQQQENLERERLERERLERERFEMETLERERLEIERLERERLERERLERERFEIQERLRIEEELRLAEIERQRQIELERIREYEEMKSKTVLIQDQEIPLLEFNGRIKKWNDDFFEIVKKNDDNNESPFTFDNSKGSFGLNKDHTARGIYWRLCLGTLSGDSNTWVEKTNNQRKKYDNLMKSYIVNPRDSFTTDISDDPLSQSENSLWNQFFDNENQQKEISHDISRTYPGTPFFERDDIQNIMIRILFIFSKQYPKIKYLQGMNEILAPVLYSVYNDSHWFDNKEVFVKQSHDFNRRRGNSNNLKDISEYFKNRFMPKNAIPYSTLLSNPDATKVIQENTSIDPQGDGLESFLRDPKYFEHDSYFIFESLMNIIGKWFTSPPSSPQPPPRVQGKFKELYDIREKEASDQAINIVVVDQCLKMFDLVQLIEPQLYSYLKDLSIEPHLYSLRWIRIILAQIFPLGSLLLIWDATFKENVIDLLPFICVAMLVNIKDNILEKDYSECLQVLFHYPISNDIDQLLESSYSIRDRIYSIKKQNGLISKQQSTPSIPIRPTPRVYPTTFTQSVPPPEPIVKKSNNTSSFNNSNKSIENNNNNQQQQNKITQQQPPQKVQQVKVQQPHSQQLQQQQQQQQQDSFGGLFSSAVSSFKQIVSDLAVIDSSWDVEVLRENQTHVSNRLERLVYILETIKSGENYETIESVQDEITAIRGVLMGNSNSKKLNSPSIDNPSNLSFKSVTHKQQQQQQQTTPVLSSSSSSSSSSSFKSNKTPTTSPKPITNNSNNSSPTLTSSSPTFNGVKQQQTKDDFLSSSPDFFIDNRSTPSVQQLKNLSLPTVDLHEDDLVEVITKDTTANEFDDELFDQINFKEQFGSKMGF
ncbi:hypothetical protein CYY_010148 [Polysphondylium violaceum]|uniref:Rab-GAP TBC domain-containing protein n=1 Tax=Polysphondylium violaceum TaxID=133409 RepID=A0A8J4PKL9_9MYCE|nr:hypothetical protein CYY_010148 [Polysphondylium violaceum]